ncbi:MAG: hypothetical protein WA903_04290, partial [Ornithinimicrobium sp.]
TDRSPHQSKAAVPLVFTSQVATILDEEAGPQDVIKDSTSLTMEATACLTEQGLQSRLELHVGWVGAGSA